MAEPQRLKPRRAERRLPHVARRRMSGVAGAAAAGQPARWYPWSQAAAEAVRERMLNKATRCTLLSSSSKDAGDMRILL